VEADDQPHLYRCASLLDAGIPVAGSTDAPFGPDDPWLAMRAAVDRRTLAGAVLGPHEAVDPVRALELFLGAPTAPGTMVRRVAPGAPADLCLLALPLALALRAPSAAAVRACWIGGRVAAGSP
jgi:predicted amidohydrolase YtcJ